MAPLLLAALVQANEPVESITSMEAAAHNRWLDAIAIAGERPSEAITCAYLLGYVVECTLKAALGRINQVHPAQDLYNSVIRQLRGTRHDLGMLLDECLQARIARLGPLGAHRESLWRIAVGNVATSHSVTFRYKSVVVPVGSLNGMYSDVEWVMLNSQELHT
jgi:hypothetical protein